jgi:hypothetical protein
VNEIRALAKRRRDRLAGVGNCRCPAEGEFDFAEQEGEGELSHHNRLDRLSGEVGEKYLREQYAAIALENHIGRVDARDDGDQPSEFASGEIIGKDCDQGLTNVPFLKCGPRSRRPGWFGKVDRQHLKSCKYCLQ